LAIDTLVNSYVSDPDAETIQILSSSGASLRPFARTKYPGRELSQPTGLWMSGENCPCHDFRYLFWTSSSQ
jgi:hypothetical protein